MFKHYNFSENEACILFHQTAHDGNLTAEKVTRDWDSAYRFAFDGDKCFSERDHKRAFIRRVQQWINKNTETL